MFVVALFATAGPKVAWQHVKTALSNVTGAWHG